MLTAVGVLASSCMQEKVLTTEQQAPQSKIVGSTMGEYEQGALLIKLTKEAQAKVNGGTLDPISLIENLSGGSIRPLFTSRPDKAAIAARYGLDRWYSVRFDHSSEPDKVAKELSDEAAIEYIEYNSLVEHVGSGSSVEYAEPAATKASAGSALPFNDPFFPEQWNLSNDGTVAATAVAGAD